MANFKEVPAVCKGMEEDLAGLQKENVALKRRSPDIDRQVEQMVSEHGRAAPYSRSRRAWRAGPRPRPQACAGLDGGTTEYIRGTTRRFKQVAAEER
jgi:hypothetical protein